MLTNDFHERIPNNGKGILLSPNVKADRFGNIEIVDTAIDELELRRCLLYWDRILNPSSSSVCFGNPTQTDFLVKSGVMECPTIPTNSTNHYPRALVDYFYSRNQQEPGAWSMSESALHFLRESGDLSGSRGTLFELYAAIPIPDRNASYEDILTFKSKWRDEIVPLQLKLDELYSRVVNSNDPSFELKRALREIESNCIAVIRLGREVGMPLRASNLKFAFSGDVSTSDIFASLAGGFGGLSFEMPELGALLGVVGSRLNVGVTSSISSKRAKFRDSPYMFVSRLHDTPM